LLLSSKLKVWIEEIIDISEGKAEECGGSIIKDRQGPNGKRVSKYILTAAHCVVDDNNEAKGPENFIIVAGSTNKVNAGTTGNVIQGVEKVHLHPDYSGPDTPHDIAILELKEDLVLDGKYKKAIKLAGSNEMFSVGTQCLASGWGRLRKNFVQMKILNFNVMTFLKGTNPNTTSENYLYQTTLKVRSYSKCADEYGDNPNNPISEESLKEHQICALGSAPDYSNTCKVFRLIGFSYNLMKQWKSDAFNFNLISIGRQWWSFGKEIEWSSNWTCLFWSRL
jgi:secreted trypsin-like serine protease